VIPFAQTCGSRNAWLPARDVMRCEGPQGRNVSGKISLELQFLDDTARG